MSLRPAAFHCDVCGIVTPHLIVTRAQFKLVCDELEKDACVYRHAVRFRAIHGVENDRSINYASMYFCARESSSLVSWAGPLAA